MQNKPEKTPLKRAKTRKKGLYLGLSGLIRASGAGGLFLFYSKQAVSFRLSFRLSLFCDYLIRALWFGRLRCAGNARGLLSRHIKNQPLVIRPQPLRF